MGTDSTTRRITLKFGVDRILSEEVGAVKKVQESVYLSSDAGCDWTGCGRCIALRCCVRQPSPNTQFFQAHFFQPSALLHAPKPIRPFPAKFQLKVAYENLGMVRESEERGVGKRKRSWSRAVFSSLQRKGLEKRFQLQQYITKPDRRQLAATLGLTDAQVKVWFQNRRMKWRHTKEMKTGGALPCQQRLSASTTQANGAQSAA